MARGQGGESHDGDIVCLLCLVSVGHPDGLRVLSWVSSATLLIRAKECFQESASDRPPAAQGHPGLCVRYMIVIRMLVRRDCSRYLCHCR